MRKNGPFIAPAPLPVHDPAQLFAHPVAFVLRHRRRRLAPARALVIAVEPSSEQRRGPSLLLSCACAVHAVIVLRLRHRRRRLAPAPSSSSPSSPCHRLCQSSAVRHRRLAPALCMPSSSCACAIVVVVLRLRHLRRALIIAFFRAARHNRTTTYSRG